MFVSGRVKPPGSPVSLLAPTGAGANKLLTVAFRRRTVVPACHCHPTTLIFTDALTFGLMADKAKENVQVIVRCRCVLQLACMQCQYSHLSKHRPVNSKESDEGQNAVVRVDDRTKQIEVTSKTNKPIKSFHFDSVFGPNATQREIYASTITPIGACGWDLRAPFCLRDFPFLTAFLFQWKKF
jgi:hypothetical protein